MPSGSGDFGPEFAWQLAYPTLADPGRVGRITANPGSTDSITVGVPTANLRAVQTGPSLSEY